MTVNNCQSAGPHGIGKYDCSCPVVSSQGVQCRTIPSCRPCGASDCTREKCSGARRSAEVFSASLSEPESDERTTSGGEPQGTSVRLSRDELWSLQRALIGRIRLYPFETALETALNKVSEALKTR
jgi:hypothetical protein